MKTSRARIILIPLLAVLGLVGCASAQFVGYTSPQTVVKTPFTAAVAPAFVSLRSAGDPAVTVHFLNYTVTGSATAIQVRIVANYTNVTATAFPISDDATDLSQGEVVGIGYYPYMWAQLVVCAGCGGAVSLSANYVGTSSSPGIPNGTYNPSQQKRKVILQAAPTSVSLTVRNVAAPYGSTAGVLIVTSSGVWGGGAIIEVVPHIGDGSYASGYSFSVPVTGTTQVFDLPASPASTIDFISTGAAGASTFSAYYLFYPPGGALPQVAQPSRSVNKETAHVAAITGQVITAGTYQRAHLFSISANCSAGSAQLTILDGTTQIWSTGATEVGTTTFRYQWNPGLAGSYGAAMTVTLSSCGGGNTGTLDVQGSVF